MYTHFSQRYLCESTMTLTGICIQHAEFVFHADNNIMVCTHTYVYVFVATGKTKSYLNKEFVYSVLSVKKENLHQDWVNFSWP